ncbi:TVP38/TMEM64 family protein [Elioraea thermophila]|uniref:TVP38/TMEM64 family protein n=1 Tax=Elioraea thermophila TaxID=2185104 RepID=UPI001E5576B7|nr:VTT domain-containing protein [Elioraea thermophila]
MTRRSSGRPRDWRAIRLRWALLTMVAALALGLVLSGAHEHLSLDTLAARHAALRAAVREAPVPAGAVFVVAYAAVVAASLPVGAVFTVAGGVLFGLWWGTALSVTGASLGAIAIFLAVRTTFAPTMARRAPRLLARLRPGLERDGAFYLLFLRLVPLFPFWLVNIAPALVGMRLGPYALATLVGIVPAAFVYAGLGAAAGEVLAAGGRPDLDLALSPAVLLPLVGLGVLALLPVAWRHVAARRRLRDG